MSVCAYVRPTRQFRILMTRRNWPGRSDSKNGNWPGRSDSENGNRPNQSDSENGRPDRAGRGRGTGTREEATTGPGRERDAREGEQD